MYKETFRRLVNNNVRFFRSSWVKGLSEGEIYLTFLKLFLNVYLEICFLRLFVKT
jgi:hypothetical protein